MIVCSTNFFRVGNVSLFLEWNVIKVISNAWSTWVGIIIGGAIGAAIAWWIYYRQKKTSEKQEHIIKRIKRLEEKHDSMLKTIEVILNQILILDKKIDSILENKTS